MNPSEKASSLALNFIHRPGAEEELKFLSWQMDHRLEMIPFWDITPGSRVLELGCGQGDCTVPLAEAVGEKGHVDAVDPGAPDYGELHTSHLKENRDSE